MNHRAIILGGGVAAFALYLLWEWRASANASQAASNAVQSAADASAYAIAGQTVETGGGVAATTPDPYSGGLPASKLPTLTPWVETYVAPPAWVDPGITYTIPDLTAPVAPGAAATPVAYAPAGVYEGGTIGGGAGGGGGASVNQYTGSF